MRPELHFLYKFHAVGQGLFASGHLYETGRNENFHWVFDCGTLSRRAYLQRELDLVKADIRREKIGLFCLSHFDKDHVNGARDFLTQQRVDLLVMPYFTLAERIRIAFGTRNLPNEYLRFLIDPAGFMFEAAGDNLGEIVFIAGGGAPPPEENEEREPTLPVNPERGPFNLHSPEAELPRRPSAEDIHGASDPSTWKAVRVLRHQSPFTLAGVWEFMFFNSQTTDEKSDGIQKEVVTIVKKHRQKDGTFDGNALLDELGPLYVSVFGKTGYAKNSISLVAYSGPVSRSVKTVYGIWGAVHPVGIEIPPWSGWRDRNYLPLMRPDFQNLSICYFGDFPLTKASITAEIQRHFGDRRWNRIQVFQAPHHGSRHSWYEGASSEFDSQIGVISSARRAKHHPSKMVLEDLNDNGVILVNEMQRATFWGRI